MIRFLKPTKVSSGFAAASGFKGVEEAGLEAFFVIPGIGAGSLKADLLADDSASGVETGDGRSLSFLLFLERSLSAGLGGAGISVQRLISGRFSKAVSKSTREKRYIGLGSPQSS